MASYTLGASSNVVFFGGTESGNGRRVGHDANTNTLMTTRYKFTTDGTGASSVSFSTARAVYNTGASSSEAEAPSRIRWNITTSATQYKSSTSSTAGYSYTSVKPAADTWEDQTSYYKGSANIKLMPNTTYYLWFWPAGFPGYVNVYLGNVTLTTSGSYGTASTITASNNTFGNNVPITLTNSSTGITHTVTVACAGITQTLATKSSSKSFTWTPAVATYAPNITTAKTASATITCTTYYGSTSWGSTTKSITMTLPNSVAPIISSINFLPYNNDLPNSAGNYITCYVQGYSKIQSTTTASAQYSGSISSYAITVDGSTVTNNTATEISSIILSSGIVPIQVTVTDSRGFITSTTENISVEPYNNPTITNKNVFRANNQGIAADDGTYLSATATANIASLDSQNTYTMEVSYRTINGDYGAPTSMISGNSVLLSGLSADLTYNSRIVLTDLLGNSTEVTQTINSQKWAMKFNSAATAIAFGKAPEVDNALEIPHNWNIVKLNQAGTKTYHALFDDVLDPNDHNMKTYSSVQQLNLVSGEATILTAWQALQYNSILRADFRDFVSGECPSAAGIVEIVKGGSLSGTQRGYILAHGEYDYHNEWRMYIDSNGNPSGTWERVYVGSVPIPIANGGTGATTAATARNNLEVTAQSHAATTFSDKNLSDVTNTTMTSLTLSAGTFVLFGYISFASNQTGYRAVWVSNSNTSGVGSNATVVAPAVGNDTRISSLWISSSSSSTTWYLRARQYSGTTLKCTGGLRAFRVSF